MSPAPREAPSPPTARAQRISAVMAEVLGRRARGETVGDPQVIQEHPELMPELAEELKVLARIRQAQVLADQAGALAEPVVVLSPDALEAPIVLSEDPSVTGESPPITMAGYRLRREISRGGQATVFQGVQASTGRVVAIKVLHGGPWANRAARGRFEREIRVLAKLQHPNIVTILDRGRASDGSLFLVMDYIDGPTLDTYLAPERGRSTADVVRLFLKILAAVAEAHREGIVHRDLKPANIRVDPRGEPYLLDFGIARRSPDAPPLGGAWSTVTIPEQIIGSVPWGSPEQVAGDGRPVDHRSDIYALGFMLHYCLARELPIPRGPNLVATLAAMRQASPRPLQTDLPGLDVVVARALAKDPRDRYPSVPAMARDLERVLAGQRPAGRPRRSRWALVVSLGVGLAILGAGMGYGRWAAHPRTQANTRADRLVGVMDIAFTRLPPGTFSSDSDERPAGTLGTSSPGRVVRLTHGFEISTHPISVGTYQWVMVPRANSRRPLGPKAPVEAISWAQATEFCKRLGLQDGRHYRLPSEAEWVYAWKRGVLDLADASPPATAPAASLAASPGGEADRWGFWCADWYGPLAAHDETDPIGPFHGVARVARFVQFDPATQRWRIGPRAAYSTMAIAPRLGFFIVREDRP